MEKRQTQIGQNIFSLIQSRIVVFLIFAQLVIPSSKAVLFSGGVNLVYFSDLGIGIAIVFIYWIHNNS